MPSSTSSPRSSPARAARSCFVRTKHGADRVARNLGRDRRRAPRSLHGGRTQSQRNSALAAFRDGSVPVLVATDVAARGIHVDDVSLVLHVDPPADPKDYLHRSGRTARAGESGIVVLLTTPTEERDVRKMLDAAGVRPRAARRVARATRPSPRVTGARLPSGVPVARPAGRTRSGPSAEPAPVPPTPLARGAPHCTPSASEARCARARAGPARELPSAPQRARDRPPTGTTERERRSPRWDSAQDLRNVAIVAHVDHGKTTLVDAMLWQSGAFTAHQADTGDVNERVMDSNDLEREKGITILAKNTAVDHVMPNGERLTINIIDTPGHADFGGEVERGLSMVDGVLLLVDASEGPLPQTRFVLRKALEAGMPVILVINKVDRPDARIAEVVDETYELFLDLDADEHQIEFPIVYASAQGGPGVAEAARGRRRCPRRRTCSRCSRRSSSTIPAPTFDDDAPLQAHVTNLDASPYLGRLALCRVHNGTIRKGQQAAWCRADGTIERVKITELLVTRALDRFPAESAGPGDIIAIAGIPEITIGETLADADDPRPLPVITIDEPSISMTIGINTVAAGGGVGQEAHRATGRSTGSTPSWSATSRSGCCRPSGPTPGRCRAAASCSSRSSSRSCAARASRSPSASRRSSPARSTASCTSRWSG